MTDRYNLVASCAALGLTMVAAPGLAQSTATAAAATASDSSIGGQGEIVVTASRRPETLRNVASSVTAIGSAQLQNLVASRFDDFVSQIPNISFAGNGRGNRLVILRGISTSSNDQNATVATYIDDTPVNSSTSLAVGSRFVPDVDAFDLERVEVLRGPQGTLYGANSLGGLLKYVTKAPSTTALELYGRAEGTTVAHGGQGYGFNAGVNVPLGEKLALRVSGFDSKEAGYLNNVATGQTKVNDLNTYGGRASLLYRPTDTLTLRASAIYQRYKTGAESTVNILNINTGQLAFGPYDQSRFTPEPQTMHFQLYTLNGDWDLGAATITSTTSYSKNDVNRLRDYTRFYAGRIPGIPFYSNSLTANTNKFTQELKLSSAANHKLEWIVGAFYTHEKSDAITNIDGQSAPGVVAPGIATGYFYNEAPSSFDQIAGYGDITLYLGKSFDITGGVRFTHDEIKLSNINNGTLNGGFSVVQGTTGKDNVWTFLVTPRFHLSNATMIYGRVSSGFRPGGPNIISPAAITAGALTDFKSDRLINYEVGVKTSALDHRLSFDGSLFYIDWTDIQIRGSTGGFFFIGNGGKATSKGGEAQVTLQPIDNLSVSFNLGYTDAHLSQNALVVGGAKGDKLPNVPNWSLGGALDYSFPLTSLIKGSFGASYRLISDRLADFNANRSSRLSFDGYATLDLRAGIKVDRVEVDVFARNVTDTRGIESAITNFTPANITISRPRTVGIAVTARY